MQTDPINDTAVGLTAHAAPVPLAAMVAMTALPSERSLVPINLPAVLTAEPPATPSSAPNVYGIDVRAISPRDMAELSLDLYLDGVLGWDEYEALAFQPELHPCFNRTIGALTGVSARPSQPRDYIKEWEDRLSFEQRRPGRGAKKLRCAKRILSALRKLAQTTGFD